MPAQTLKYIRLYDSVGATKYRYRVLHTTLKPILSTSRSSRRTVTGALDVQEGARWRAWQMVLKVYHTDADSNYGDLGILQTLLNRNNPNGSPSNLVTFEENLDTDGNGTGDTHTCVFSGAMSWDNGVQRLDGTGAF